MNPPGWIAKAIAAGSLSKDELRVTVTFTPPGGLAPEALSRWPSMVLTALREQPVPWQVMLSVVVVRKDATMVCGPSYNTLINASTCRIPGMAHAAQDAWKDGAPEWLDKLWRYGFRRDGKVPDEKSSIWKSLSTALGQSNGGSNIVEGRVSQPGNQQVPEVWDAATGTPKVVQQGPPENGGKIKVDALNPSRQTDLAVLLEAQRALALCNTVQGALGSPDYAAQEAAAQVVEAKAPASALDALFQATATHYDEISKNLRSEYDNVCPAPAPPPVAPKPYNPGNLAQADRMSLATEAHGALDSHEAATQPQDSTNSATYAEF